MVQEAIDFIDFTGTEKEKVKSYTFSTSGHSLGALLSDLTAAEIMSRGLKFDKSITFENPGSRTLIEKAIKDNLFTGKEVKLSTKSIAVRAEVYNNKPNFINTCKSQLSDTVHFLVDSPKRNSESKKERKVSESKWSLYGKVVNAFSTFITTDKQKQQLYNPVFAISRT